LSSSVKNKDKTQIAKPKSRMPLGLNPKENKEIEIK
jgi:hypothetical protein